MKKQSMIYGLIAIALIFGVLFASNAINLASISPEAVTGVAPTGTTVISLSKLTWRVGNTATITLQASQTGTNGISRFYVVMVAGKTGLNQGAKIITATRVGTSNVWKATFTYTFQNIPPGIWQYTDHYLFTIHANAINSKGLSGPVSNAILSISK